MSEAAASISGIITYRQPVALPAGAVIAVKLADVSRADAPAITIAAQTITTTGQQVPIPFTLNYDPTAINPRCQYAVQAQILINGNLRWINTSRYSVITQGNPNTVEIMVEPVSPR